MRINLASTFTLIVSGALFIGCGDDGGVTTTGATASGSTGENTGTTGTTTTGTPTTSTSTTNDTTGSPTTTTTGPDSTSTTEPETSTTTTTGPDTSSGGVDTTGEPDTTGGSTGGGDDVCAPAPGDDACIMCTKSECCDELKSCMMEEACACFVECAQTNPNPIVCLGQCPGVNLMHPFLACAQDCGCG